MLYRMRHSVSFVAVLSMRARILVCESRSFSLTRILNAQKICELNLVLKSNGFRFSLLSITPWEFNVVRGRFFFFFHVAGFPTDFAPFLFFVHKIQLHLTATSTACTQNKKKHVVKYIEIVELYSTYSIQKMIHERAFWRATAEICYKQIIALIDCTRYKKICVCYSISICSSIYLHWVYVSTISSGKCSRAIVSNGIFLIFFLFFLGIECVFF